MGLLVIWHNRSATLKSFAYAGFLLDLLLAGCAHLAQREIPEVLLVLGTLVVWAAVVDTSRRTHLRRD